MEEESYIEQPWGQSDLFLWISLYLFPQENNRYSENLAKFTQLGKGNNGIQTPKSDSESHTFPLKMMFLETGRAVSPTMSMGERLTGSVHVIHSWILRPLLSWLHCGLPHVIPWAQLCYPLFGWHIGELLQYPKEQYQVSYYCHYICPITIIARSIPTLFS